MIVLETQRLVVQMWELEQWPEFKPLAQNPDVMRYIGSGKTWDDERIQKWVQRQLDDQARDGFCFWQLRDKATQKLIGFCGLHRLGTTEDVEIGWWILPDHWGKGLASEAASAVLDHAFEVIGLERVTSICHEDNKASERIMQKIGLRFERALCSSELGLNVKIPCVLYAKG